MSNWQGILRLGAALAFALVASNATADTRTDLDKWIAENRSAQKYTPEEAMQMMPPGPNPMLSLLPAGAKTDDAFWRARNKAMAAAANANRAPANVRLQFKKNRGTVIRAFGTGKNQEASINLVGEADLPPPSLLIANPEDEGSIPLATDTGLTTGLAVTVSGVIGDGPFGSAGTASGDVDFFMLPNVQAGQLITVDIDTPSPFGALDPFVALWDAAGNLLAFNDDDGSTFDSLLLVNAPADGTYYVSVTGFGTFITGNPFDSSTGLGLGSEGTYDALIGLDYADNARVSFQLNKGEIFGASLISDGLSVLSLSDKTGLERQGSAQNFTGIHPAANPLPGSGGAALSHAVDTTGEFSLDLLLTSSGPFELELRAFRNPLKEGGTSNDVQTIFLDFDGQVIDNGAIFFGFPPGFIFADLSPLSAFLPGWGLTADDEDAVIDAIVASVEESLVTDVRKLGREPTQEIVLLNSRDHADPGDDDPNVSRIVVGGTIPELQIGTIGIAQSIDVGNFERSETAVVLLDLLSAPASNPNSLNQFTIGPDATIIDLIGIGVGNITAHEAGHFLGNWHTDQFNDLPSIQDQGGNLPNFIGLGPDGIFGTADDVDVDFGRDEFVPSEGFTGIEDTLNSIAIGTPTPRGNSK